MNTKIFGIMNHKGGVGKTATTISLADALIAKNPTKRILLIDGDEQSSLKTVFGVKLKDAEGGLAKILIENIKPELATVSVRPRIDLIPSGGRFIRKIEAVSQNLPHAPLLMRERLAEHAKKYDYVLVDLPPALGQISSMTAAFVDYILIPCAPDMLSLVGARNTVGFFDTLELEWAGKGYPIAEILGAIPTMQAPKRNLDTDVAQQLAELADRTTNDGKNFMRGGIVFSGIPSDIKVKTAQVKRKLLSEGFTKSNAYIAYQTVVAEIIEAIEKREEKTETKSSVRSQPRELSSSAQAL
ncbi:ParA family protein [Bdellovibrionota bacterium FG-2]